MGEKIPEFHIILVEPKYSGNIGFIARVMANFDFNNLYLVNPCKLDDECFVRAMHAQNVLDDAKIFSSFEECIKNFDYLVATSSIESKSEKKHLRNAVLLEDFCKKIYEVDGKIGIVFGREDYGLYNEEIASCDIMLKIPTSEKYPSMNLSHSVAVVLYSLYIYKDKKLKIKKTRALGKIEKEKLFSFFSDLLDEINYPEHKKEKTKIMFKRVMGRAMPSKWEYHTLMGVLSGSLDKIKNKKG
ncbi:MAG: RNA methyltransferase [Candidatus Thermoplasmatota archaeon]|jgi:TrmH family RNA methyltransferase|nr:RNA methyltransferase [Candidatus Thermoplasmatota archaeon]